MLPAAIKTTPPPSPGRTKSAKRRKIAYAVGSIAGLVILYLLIVKPGNAFYHGSFFSADASVSKAKSVVNRMSLWVSSTSAGTGLQPAAHPETSTGHSTEDTLPVSRKDIVVAMHSAFNRLAMVEATRAWRKGVRTYVAVEADIADSMPPEGFSAEERASNLETFGSFWNQEEVDPNRQKEGDVRAALTPFLANVSFGIDTYKWMVYGDDDTVFFMDNVLELVAGLDPEMPYLLTDCLWWPGERPNGRAAYTHPNRMAPRCLPCNYTDPADVEGFMPEGFFAPRGCPCTAEVLCTYDNVDAFTKPECEFRDSRPDWWYFLHGGAGAIMSVGLMRRASFQEVHDQVVDHSFYFSGDSMLTDAVFKVMGILPTDPGYGYFRPHVQVFDPSWRHSLVRGPEDAGTQDRGNDPVGMMQRLEWALAGTCNATCIDQVTHAVSVHIRARYADKDITVSSEGNGAPHWRSSAYLISRLGQLAEELARKRKRRGGWLHS